MIEIRAVLPSLWRGEIECGRIIRENDRSWLRPGTLAKAGTNLDWEWVKVEIVDGDEALFSRLMPAGCRIDATDGVDELHGRGKRTQRRRRNDDWLSDDWVESEYDD